MVLEVDAPVHEAAEAYETNGGVPYYGVVNDVAERGSSLACNGADSEDANCSNGLSFAPDTV